MSFLAVTNNNFGFIKKIESEGSKEAHKKMGNPEQLTQLENGFNPRKRHSVERSHSCHEPGLLSTPPWTVGNSDNATKDFTALIGTFHCYWLSTA